MRPTAPDLSPYLVGGFAPIHDERAACVLPVIGEVPRDLHGMFVRNGPNAKFSPRGRYHWFDGDGMLHAVQIQGGRVTYRNRWIRTEHLAAEEAAGHALWSGLLEPTRDNPRGAPYKDTANTDVLFHRDSLLSSWYICGRPYRVDPRTLDTLGPDDFGSGEPLRMSAHAKVDPGTGELFFFDYGPQPPFLRYGVVDATGRLVHRADIDLPGPRLPHDMAITERFAILMDLPVTFTPEALKARKWSVGFYPEMPSRFAILPRRGGVPRWFEAEPCYIYHTVNAWEEGDEVVLVACRVADPVPPIDPADGPWARMMANLRIHSTLHRFRFNLITGATREERLDDRVSEFPTIANAWRTKRSRWSYNVTFAPTPTVRFDGLIKYDTDTGAAERFDFGPGRFGSESPFAPRLGAAAEDDGYVLSFVNDEREGAAELWILRAQQLARGPVARVRLPQRIPFGFHGAWVDGAQLGWPA
jgi:carotenoid cleavage dioxygenase